jgi:hypothetical protein
MAVRMIGIAGPAPATPTSATTFEAESVSEWKPSEMIETAPV